MREAVEEAGVHVAIKGLLAIESLHGGQWRRVIFYAGALLLVGAGCGAPLHQQLCARAPSKGGLDVLGRVVCCCCCTHRAGRGHGPWA